MQPLRDLIEARLADGKSVLVFPSQVAADAWAIEALGMGGGGAVDPDRLVVWDRFKERFLSTRRDDRPANRVTRTLWAALVVSRQTREPFLERILGSGKPSPSFVGFLSTVPPALAAIARGLENSLDARLGQDPLILDLLRLHEDCRRFMETRSLFEPSWERPSVLRLDRPHLLVAPELVEDWDEWRDHLEGIEGFATWPLPVVGAARVDRPTVDSAKADTAGAGTATALLSYENAWEEYRDVFLRIAALLDSGIRADEIGVTVSDLDAARPWVEEAAAKAGVPLVVRSGLPLASSPFGRLLAAIGAATESGFGLPAMKALLLDRFAVWKEAEAATNLVRFGIEHHAFASWTRGSATIDVWEESFRVTGRTGLRSWYRLLRRALLDMAGARDFRALGQAVTAFRKQFLDEDGWSSEENRLVERCMEELAALGRAEADYARGERLPSPFALWMATLRSEGYVPQRHGAFVQVYPWRVSALLPFKYHFLLGCGFDAVAVRYGAENFLREDQKEALGRSGRDATLDFLRAYLLSGDLVFPCHATEEIGGWSAPHPFFSAASTKPGRETTAEIPLAPDPLALEGLAWAGLGEIPTRLLPMQKAAFDPVDTRALEALLPRLSREGRLRMSHTLLDEYRACPFRWLVARALRVEEEILDPGFFDALLAGDMAHRAIEHLFEGMRGFGLITGSHLDEYRRLAAEAPAAILPEFARDKGPFLEPMFEAWSPLLADRLLRLVDHLASDPGWEVGELESAKEFVISEDNIVLEGRIDRLARRGEELAIVDYKKRRMPAKAALVVAKESAGDGASGEGEDAADDEARGGDIVAGELANTQIASYVSLVEAGGERVKRAYFWSIEDAKDRVVIGDDGLRPPGGYGMEIASFRELLSRAAKGIREGRFGWAAPSSPACRNCRVKPVCRSHYSAGR